MIKVTDEEKGAPQKEKAEEKRETERYKIAARRFLGLPEGLVLRVHSGGLAQRTLKINAFLFNHEWLVFDVCPNGYRLNRLECRLNAVGRRTLAEETSCQRGT